ncbi:MAG: hypothetical protein R3Y27_02575, partial [Clostridia bacterium]
MKKLLAIVLSLVLSFNFVFTTLAVTDTLILNKSSANVGVYGLYVSEEIHNNYETDVFENGEAEVVVGTNIEINVEIDENDYSGYIRLIVVLIDENDGEIYTDFEDIYKDDCIEFYPFDIFFVDEDYNVITDIIDFTVTFSDVSDLTETPIVSYVDGTEADGLYEVGLIDATIKSNDDIIISSNETGYYVISYKEEVATPESTTETTTEEPTTEPTTEEPTTETTTVEPTTESTTVEPTTETTTVEPTTESTTVE